MINTVSELRDALMIDLESDSDIAMLDASCEVAEYAMESAAFEYDGVNTAAFEAADNNFIDKASEFCKNLCGKIKKFCIAAIRTIRMILPKLKMAVNRAVNAYRSGAAKRMQEKIEKINAKDSKSAAKLGTEEIKKSDLAFLAQGLKKDPYKFVDECLKKANDSDKIVGTKKDLDVKLEDLTGDIKNDDSKARVDSSTCKNYLDRAVEYLNSLNKSTELQRDWLDKMAEGGNSTGIRRAMATSYNMATSAVRKYYHISMNLAQKFVGVDKHYKTEEKIGKAINKVAKPILNADYKRAKKYAEKHNIGGSAYAQSLNEPLEEVE